MSSNEKDNHDMHTCDHEEEFEMMQHHMHHENDNMHHHMGGNMHHYMHHHMEHEELIKTIQHCEATCEHMITHLLGKHDIHMRIRQIQFLRDCADICTLTAKYIARRSAFSKHMANLCSHICEMCGRECSKFPDQESQDCARICLHCARECREFAEMRYW